MRTKRHCLKASVRVRSNERSTPRILARRFEGSVLFNTGGGPINYIEIRSQLAGNERVRVVFNNGTDYNLDGIRAGTLLRQLRERGHWTPPAEAIAGTGSRIRA